MRLNLHMLLRRLCPLALVLALALGCNLAQRLKKEIDKSSSPTVLTSTDGRFQLTVPGGWREDRALNSEAQIQASNRVQELYVVVITESKQDFPSDTTLEKFTTLTRDLMTQRLTMAVPTNPVALSVNGNPAMQYEITGTISGIKISYINTAVETREHYHQILSWTLPARFSENQSILRSVTQTFKEVGGGTSTTKPVEHPSPSQTRNAK